MDQKLMSHKYLKKKPIKTKFTSNTSEPSDDTVSRNRLVQTLTSILKLTIRYIFVYATPKIYTASQPQSRINANKKQTKNTIKTQQPRGYLDCIAVTVNSDNTVIWIKYYSE